MGPNEAQLVQMRERPWNGVHFGDEYLGSLEGMDRLTRVVLATFASHGVDPIVESKVRSDEDVAKLQSLLEASASAAGAGGWSWTAGHPAEVTLQQGELAGNDEASEAHTAGHIWSS